MGFKINKVKADLRSYPPFLIMGEAKVGKTTLFRDLVLLNYKNPAKGLLISLGQEEGYHSLDDLNYEEAQEWTALEDENGNRGLVEIIDEVLETQSDKENKIEMVCLDTLDELVKRDYKQQEINNTNDEGKFLKQYITHYKKLKN